MIYLNEISAQAGACKSIFLLLLAEVWQLLRIVFLTPFYLRKEK